MTSIQTALIGETADTDGGRFLKELKYLRQRKKERVCVCMRMYVTGSQTSFIHWREFGCFYEGNFVIIAAATGVGDMDNSRKVFADLVKRYLKRCLCGQSGHEKN